MDFEQNLDDSLGIISEEQLAVVDEGNEQSWLYCPEGIDKNVLLDISEFLRFPQHIVPDQTSRVSTLDEKGHEVSMEDHPPINDLEIPGRERRSSFLPTSDLNLSSVSIHERPFEIVPGREKFSYSSNIIAILQQINFINFKTMGLDETMLSNVSEPTFLNTNDSVMTTPGNVSDQPMKTNTSKKIYAVDSKLSFDRIGTSQVCSTPKRRGRISMLHAEISFDINDSVASAISNFSGQQDYNLTFSISEDSISISKDGTFALLDQSPPNRRYSTHSQAKRRTTLDLTHQLEIEQPINHELAQNCGSELSAAPTDTTKNRLSFTVVNRSPAHWNKETELAANDRHELVHREIDSPGLPVDEEPKPIVDYEEHGDPTKPTKVRLSFTLEKPSLIWSQGYRRDATDSSVQEEETPQLKALPASGLSIFRKSSLPKPVIQNIHRKTPTRNKKECSSAPNTARLNKPKKSRIPTRAREEIKISENGKKLSQATDNPIYSER